MQAQKSPFRPYWWAFGLEAAGVASRATMGTYGQFEFEALPPIPRQLSDNLAWLEDQPTPQAWSIGTKPVVELPALEAACGQLGLKLPVVFLDFLRSPRLQSKIRSCTACYISVGPTPVTVPGIDGHLIRFLADQQGCLYWYLYLTATDHAVVCSADFYGGPGDSYTDDGEIEFCGESFESFLYRFWLENEIWFAANDGEPMSADAEQYIRRYQTDDASCDH
ncbi:hypothetical protein [Paractinoplanes brasiliensis]|uniref:SMI1/KNR4 family protein SUKH-1 n=1 Tax=Paractinoplanes brasiliensis TaxID=52695 RepID=A0A4R6JY67_9ACTN|nr:hypothetical protein [Actinoplanes brasiliensis]TDO41793.1 hypothetical protein C8E87_5536 [Actinoplanes brasiliensis]GID29938.1 hypothetical protein Abr02nite_49210 [Actinoplanes brasiliensis]